MLSATNLGLLNKSAAIKDSLFDKDIANISKDNEHLRLRRNSLP